jgi:hypothetical protein
VSTTATTTIEQCPDHRRTENPLLPPHFRHSGAPSGAGSFAGLPTSQTLAARSPTGGLGPPGPALSAIGSGVGGGVSGGKEWRGAKSVSHVGEVKQGSSDMESRVEVEW